MKKITPHIRRILASQLFRNSYWGMADLVIYPLLMIVATPIFIEHLGARQYGLWMILTVIVQVMNALNMGVGDSTIRMVSKLRAQGNTTPLYALVNKNFSLSLVLLLLTSVVGFGTTFIIRHFDLFHISSYDMDEAMSILLFFSVSAGLKFIEQVFLSVFKGMERFDIASRLSLLSRSSTVLAAIGTVLAGYGLYEIVLATLACNVLNLLVQVVTLRKRFHGLDMLPRFQFESWQDIFLQNGWYWLQSVIALLGFLSDRFLIALFVDLETIGYYSIAALVGSQIHNILLAFGTFVFPRVSYKNELNSDPSADYYVSRLAIAGMGWGIIAFLLLFGNVFFRLWLGAETYSHAIRFIELYLCFEAIILLIIIPFHFLNAGAFVKLNSLFEILLRGSHFIAMVVLYRFYGTNGLIWGLILATLVNVPFQYYLFNKHILHIHSWKEALLPMVPALFFVGLAGVEGWLFKSLLVLLIAVSFVFIYGNRALEAYRLRSS